MPQAALEHPYRGHLRARGARPGPARTPHDRNPPLHPHLGPASFQLPSPRLLLRFHVSGERGTLRRSRAHPRPSRPLSHTGADTQVSVMAAPELCPRPPGRLSQPRGGSHTHWPMRVQGLAYAPGAERKLCGNWRSSPANAESSR